MSETNKEVLGAYKELKGILISIEKENSWFNDEGFTGHANQVIERVGLVCSEIKNIDQYKLQREHLNDGRVIVHTTQARQKLHSLIGRIEGEYGLDDMKSSTGPTFIQSQSQNQSQHVALVLDLQEKILNELPKHKEGSKERNFLEKIKSALPSIKNAMDVLSLALKIGSELGLDPSDIHNLLGL